jgi:hypothetical protein
MPEWSGKLRNLYWQLRDNRNWKKSFRRQIYRKIADEKKRLYETGVDPELVRLLCRHFCNPRNARAEAIFKNFEKQLNLPFDALNK